MRRPWAIRALTFLYLLSHAPCLADSPRPPTRFVLVLADGLSLDDLLDDSRPALARFAQESALGLMSAPIAPPARGCQRETAALATLAEGALTPAEPGDEEAYNLLEVVEGDSAGRVWERRTLLDLPAPRPGSLKPAVHLGIASLVRRGARAAIPNVEMEWARIAVLGNADTDRPGRRAAIFGMDASGYLHAAWLDRSALAANRLAPFGVQDDPERLNNALDAWGGNAVIHLGDFARAEAARARIGEPAYRAARRAALARLEELVSRLARGPARSANILVIGAHAPAEPGGGWRRLAGAALHGPGIQPGLLTSATTRTPGVISNLDILPTLRGWQAAPQSPSLAGHVLEPIPASEPAERARRIDRLVHANSLALYPFLGALGAAAALIVFGGLGAVVGAGGVPIPLRFALLALMNMPLAMLLAVILSPDSPLSLAGIVLAWMVVCAACEMLLARFLPLRTAESGRAAAIGIPPGQSEFRLIWLVILLAVAVTLDAFAGQPLVKFSLLSSYQMQGIRFYGIGNEYMGILIGATLCAAFLARLGKQAAAIAFVLAAGIVGWPTLGANAGGLVAAAVTFGVGWRALAGGRAGWKVAAGWAIAGLAAALALALADRALAGSHTSHFGAALQAAGDSGWSHLADIAVRKAAMNARILGDPRTLLAVAGIGVLAALCRSALRDRLHRLCQRHPSWRQGVPAAGWGALAAFAFNDSGIVAALFLFGAFLMSGLYFAFEDSVVPPDRESAAEQP